MNILEELAAAVRTFYLSVTEQVDTWQYFFLQNLQTMRSIIPPVVAVGEVESVDVPLVRRIAGGDNLVGQAVGRANLGAARFACVIKRVLIHFLGHCIVDNVDCLHTLVVSLDPGVDPEGLDADDLFLFVGHGAGHVHHVNEDSDTLGQVDVFPAAILLVLPNRHNNGIAGIIGVRSDLPPQRSFESALEVAQRFRPSLTNAGVFITSGNNIFLAARLDAWQGQLFSQDSGHFLHCQLDFEDMPARLIPGSLGGLALSRSERLADLTVALADAARTFVAIAELGDLDLRQRDTDQIFSLFADQLSSADVFGQV